MNTKILTILGILLLVAWISHMVRYEVVPTYSNTESDIPIVAILDRWKGRIFLSYCGNEIPIFGDGSERSKKVYEDIQKIKLLQYQNQFKSPYR